MKNIIKSLTFIAIIAVTFSACQKNTISEIPDSSQKIFVRASQLQTKTHLDDDYNVIWDSNETMCIFCTSSESAAPAYATSEKGVIADSDGKEADFTFTLSGTTDYSNFIYGGVYPASAITTAGNSQNTPSNAYKVSLSNNQSPTATAYDAKEFIMVAKPQVFSESQTTLTQYFRKAVALNNITFTNCAFAENEKVSMVKITVPEGNGLTGRKSLDITTGDFGDFSSSAYKFNYVTLNYATPFEITGKSFNAWFTSWGIEFSEGKLLIEIETSKGTYNREISITKSISFKEGKYNILSVDMESATFTAKSTEDYSGEWLIVGTDPDTEKRYAAKKFSANTSSSPSNFPAMSITMNADGTVDLVDGIEDCKMIIGKITDGGDYDGLYTIKDADGKYLYAASSSKNQMMATTDLDANCYWKVEYKENAWSIVASKSSNRNVMQFNVSNKIFNCYASASQETVSLVSYDKVVIIPPIKPFNIEKVPAEGVNGATTTLTLNGVSSATATPDGIVVTSASVSGTTLTYTVSENTTSAPRDGSITLSADGVENVVVKVSQLAAGADKKLVFDFSSAVTDWPTTASSSAKSYAYSLGGVNYSFELNNVYCGSNLSYLMLKSTGYLGLPVIDGYKLAKVVAKSSSTHSTKTNVAVTSNTTGTAVTGGTTQTWSKTGTEYTYSLTDTSAGTMYYLYVTNKNCQIVTLTLTYTKSL